jgi:hypothetical protein
VTVERHGAACVGFTAIEALVEHSRTEENREST